MALLARHPDEDLIKVLEHATYGQDDGFDVYQWADAAAGISGIFSQLQQITPHASWSKLWAGAGLPPPPALTAPSIKLEQHLAAVATRRRSSGVRVATALHGGNLDLLRLCFEELPAWAEDPRVAALAGADLVWVDSYSRVDDVPLAPHQWCSRLEGMEELADKTETEVRKALDTARARAVERPHRRGASPLRDRP